MPKRCRTVDCQPPRLIEFPAGRVEPGLDLVDKAMSRPVNNYTIRNTLKPALIAYPDKRFSKMKVTADGQGPFMIAAEIATAAEA